MRSYYLSIEVPFIGTSSLAGQVSFGEEKRSFREHKKGKKLLSGEEDTVSNGYGVSEDSCFPEWLHIV